MSGSAPRQVPQRSILETPQDADRERKKQLADLERLKQSGRESTVLSGNGGKLGGAA